MKKWLSLIITVLFAGWIVGKLPVPKDKGFAVHEFGSLPILSGGRRQPIESLAINSLLQLRGKQTANEAPWKSGAKTLSATEWFMEVALNPAVADTRPVFRIDHPDLKGLLSLPLDKGPDTDAKHFSWSQINVKANKLLEETQRVLEVPSGQRNHFDKAVLGLWTSTMLYQQLKMVVQPPEVRDWPTELRNFLENREAGLLAARAQAEGKDHDKAALDRIIDDVSRFHSMEQLDELGARFNLRMPLFIPPAEGSADDGWQRAGAALKGLARGGEPNFALAYYARMGAAFRAGDTALFNQTVTEYKKELSPRLDANLKLAKQEQYFNHLQLFYLAMNLCIFAFLGGVIFWFKPNDWEWLRRSAANLLILATILTSVGLVYRMILIGRPPVINLYSSAIFIAWGAPVLGLILERFWRNSIGLVVGSMIGAMCLIVAHYLSLERDTLEMLRAVLDTNFWLATHVVIVTLGYAATFVAGFLGIIYIFRGVFTDGLTQDIKRSLARMVYGIVCFATLFSFVGTVLGGIWADQSWGRFWGWDPKENGAIMIVLWNAILLHARWGGLVRERGLMNLAIGGNIITSWSWFGTNMLGIGLHSYGFMDAAFYALMSFVVAMLVFIGLGLIPENKWRSFRNPPPPSPKGGKKPELQPA